MKLQTVLPLAKPPAPLIDYQSRLLLLGSCFVENIGGKLNYYQIQCQKNPLGILFHPLAIVRLIKRAIKQEWYTEAEVFQHQGQWHCFDAHSLLSASTREGLLQSLNHQLEITRQQFAGISHLVLTLGTAWVYVDKLDQRAVANCHKLPQRHFEKQLLSPDQIKGALVDVIKMVRELRPQLQIILTISPVRHLKDGFVENSRSKAHLITAVHQIVEEQTEKNLHYFPAYELMMDELRDYRFYAVDMVHPSPLAIDYIWERFKTVWIDPQALQTMEKVAAVQLGLNHRPFNPQGEEHRKFLQQLQGQKEELLRAYPHMKFS